MFSSFSNYFSKIREAISKPVFFFSASIIFTLMVTIIYMGPEKSYIFPQTLSYLTEKMGWFYVLSVTGFLFFCIFLALGRFAQVKLGPDHSEPEYSFLSWFAMLFSAGIGIGLLFFGVAEPVTHFISPPNGDPQSIAAAKQAMQITYFHWGINAWAVYAIVGLILAYFSFRHDMPLTIRSALYPIIGDRIYGPIGHFVDVFAIVGVMFGVATSLGLGVSQINTGLAHIFGLEISSNVQLLLIMGITLIATISVVSGLDAGIKRLSEINMILACLVLLFVIVAGPTLLIFNSFGQNIGLYLEALVSRSFMLGAYGGNKEWLGNWTLFYWGWWISWSPFVGIFIARISRGRTIREFLAGVLLVPTLFTFLWMTAFGNGAIAMIMDGTGQSIAIAVQDNLPMGLFAYLEHFPFASVVSVIAIILIITFFVTSSDSGSLVIDTIASGGDMNPPIWQRIFWALTEGVVAATLLVMGGLAALQAATITAALPFTFVIIIACFGLWRALKMEEAKTYGAVVAPNVPMIGEGGHWKGRLNSLLAHPTRAEVENNIKTTVNSALEKVAKEIEKSDSLAKVVIPEEGNEMRILHGDETDFLYAVKIKSYRKPDFAYMTKHKDDDKDELFSRAEVYLLEGGQDYDVYGLTEEQLIHDVLSQYDKHMHFLHLAR